MDRVACVDLDRLRLQLLLQRKGERLRNRPVAVVRDDRPHSPLLEVNQAARSAGARPGMRFAAALSLVRGLYAAVVPQAEVQLSLEQVGRILQHFSPVVEVPAARAGLVGPATFWLQAGSIRALAPSWRAWAVAIHRRLAELGLTASIAVGFSRFGTCAACRWQPGIRLFHSPKQEQQQAARSPLMAFPLRARTLRELHRLGFERLGQLADLPASSLQVRYGAEVVLLKQLCTGQVDVPVQRLEPPPPLEAAQELEPPIIHREAVLHVVEELLNELEGQAQGRLPGKLALWLIPEPPDPPVHHVLRPAEPEWDRRTLMDLCRLRLEAGQLCGRIEGIKVRIEPVRCTPDQRVLFPEKTVRDLKAAHRALARLRAEFGEEAVVRAQLLDAHLPERRFCWVPMGALALEPPEELSGPPSLVRRLRRLPVRAPQNGWRPLGDEPVRRLSPAFFVSSHWWKEPAEREYRFCVLEDGALLWLCRDRLTNRWQLAGTVE